LLPKTLHVKRHEQLIAILDSCYPEEMFWLTCTVQRLDGFQEVETILQAAEQAGEQEDWGVVDEYYATLKRMGVTLFDPETNEAFVDFILYVDDQNADLRI